MLFSRERELGENQKHEEEKSKEVDKFCFDISDQFDSLGRIAICAHWV